MVIQVIKLNTFFIKVVLITVVLLFAFKVGKGQLYSEPEVGTFAGQAENVQESPEPGLLFYLSGEHRFSADFCAGGQSNPNFLSGVKIIADGAKGAAFEAADDQTMSYWAPGNIFAQRGTLSFFWRSRYPVGPTPFPVFRVAFADHTSWDMAWLRIDYNGSGFDAFVTDIGLSRTRVSYFMDEFPAPDEWTHIALSWDENQGIFLYINGMLVQKKSVVGKIFDTGLDQFGPHSRIISPYQVQSAFSFMRGGDLDELRIYDRMLSDHNITELYRFETPDAIPTNERNLNERYWRDAWWDRHGWNLPHEPPPMLPDEKTAIRKVEIHDAFDVRRWFWKANDGIRETTWPGVYNMSRLPGRYDYFVLPDWDCYSMSGQSIKFLLPDEPWNHVEIWGKAWGQLTLEKQHGYDHTFAVRKKDQIKSLHQLDKSVVGGTLRYDNALIEEPMGELGVYNIQKGIAPEGDLSELFYLAPTPENSANGSVQSVVAFIDGRYPKDERTKLVGSSKKVNLTGPVSREKQRNLPFVHLMIPYNNHPDFSLDGIEIELPALHVKSTHGDLYPMNIRVKDPLWPMRDLADFSFSIKPNGPQTVWIDTRDRMLPEGSALYVTLAGAGYGLNAEALTNVKLRLVYKLNELARIEHEQDRFTQIRDIYGFIVEERPINSRLNLYNRFEADRTDLLKANPNHWLAKAYKFAYMRDTTYRPEYEIAACPEGIPQWAFLQTEYMQLLANIAHYYIDERQISNGEFGGGLSDDDDFTNLLAGFGLLGIEPEKIKKSLQLFMEGYYDYDREPYDVSLRQPSLPLFTNGLATISTDLLHAYEEGIEAVGQLMLVDYGNPLYINRGMETAKKVLEELTAKNADGNRYFRSRLFGGTSMSEEDPWNWSGAYSYNMLHSAYLIARYNGNPKLRQLIIELADGLLAKQDEQGNINTDIQFDTGAVRGITTVQGTWQVLYAAYEFTGDEKYREPIKDRLINPQVFDNKATVDRYTDQIKSLGVQEYINTEGSIWIDRIAANSNDIQMDRLGGVAIARIRNIYPLHYVSWQIEKPATYKSLATYVLHADATKMNVMAFNLDEKPVNAVMDVWKIKPGRWKISQGIDINDDQKIDTLISEEIVDLERGSKLKLTFSTRQHTILHFALMEPDQIDPWKLPDLAICKQELNIKGNEVTVRVFSQGTVGTPETTLELRDARGALIKSMPVPSLDAPLDLVPKWTDVKIIVPQGTDLSRGSITIDPDNSVKQITRGNTEIIW